LMPEISPAPELTVIVVTWNTRALTLRCLDTLYQYTDGVSLDVVVVDNDSADGSADAIAAAFPQVRLIRSTENLGFARANNEAAKLAASEWLLLLNSDTEVHAGAIRNLLAFSKQHPVAGITGGRTVFPDGSLNPSSCWNRITPWSLFCLATGLSVIFKHTTLFNPEGIGGWKRDSVAHVDIVQGSFFMLRTDLWRQLGGFDLRYFMYGEEADMCLRAARLGYKPMITPDAEIMHLGGASAPKLSRMVQNWKAKTTLIRTHWPKALVQLGLAELWFACATRRFAILLAEKLTGRQGRSEIWRGMWAQRIEWLKGY